MVDITTLDLKLFISNNYNIIATIAVVLLLIYSIYNKIKFLCLRAATEKVASVEKMSGLTGEQKFALVIKWINEELPSIFRNAFFQSIIDKLVQFDYDNCFNYMKNYIKRKTCYDISTIIDKAQVTSSNKQDNT